MAVGQEDALALLGHQVEVGVGEIEDEAFVLASPAVAPRGAQRDVVEEEPPVVRAGRVPLGVGRHVGQVAHLVLDHVPDVEVVVAGNIDELPSEAVSL